MAIIQALCSLVLFGVVVSAQSETHSLYYIYTALSKPMNLPGIYDFTAMGLLNDRPIDYYNSEKKIKIPKQTWMEEKMPPDYWDKGTQSRKSKEQWFNVNVNILMDRMGHNKSDVHVLQWRHGCEIKKQGNEVTFSKGIDQYSYDGSDFLSFDDKVSQWVAPNDAALETKMKWDKVPILNQYTKGYLEKECVDWLNKFREYGDKELRKYSPPDVHVFAKMSSKNNNKLKLTCLATGFFPKDVLLFIRKYRTSLPDDEIESTGVRPNHDGTYQLRKSVEIPQNEKADYDCFVNHVTLTESIKKKWDGTCSDCSGSIAMGIAIGIAIGAVVVLCVLAGVLFLLKKRGIIKCHTATTTDGEMVTTVSGPEELKYVNGRTNNQTTPENEPLTNQEDLKYFNGGTNNQTAPENESLINRDETPYDSGRSTGSSSNSSSSQEGVNKNQ